MTEQPREETTTERVEETRTETKTNQTVEPQHVGDSTADNPDSQ